MTPAPDPEISIVIPVLEESGNLERCLGAIPADPLVEVIVSDGGSADGSVDIARRSDAAIIHSETGRARQMNAGARVASGQVLLFLHADTRLPVNAADAIRQALRDGFSMGCFERVFDTAHPLLLHTSRWAGWRAKKFFIVYGDQAVFIRRDLFEHLGGYRGLGRFEDVDLALRAKQHGRWAVLPDPVVTDARRFGSSPVRRILKDAWLTAAWLAGIPGA